MTFLSVHWLVGLSVFFKRREVTLPCCSNLSTCMNDLYFRQQFIDLVRIGPRRGSGGGGTAAAARNGGFILSLDIRPPQWRFSGFHACFLGKRNNVWCKRKTIYNVYTKVLSLIIENEIKRTKLVDQGMQDPVYWRPVRQPSSACLFLYINEQSVVPLYKRLAYLAGRAGRYLPVYWRPAWKGL